MADRGQRRRRAGGRAGAAERRGGDVIDQMPWRLPVNMDRPTEPLDEEGVQAIHDGAMRILEEIGIEFLNEESLGILKEAGCKCRRHQREDGPRLGYGNGRQGAVAVRHHAS